MTILSMALVGSCMRGECFHNFLVEKSALGFQEVGFSTTLECPVHLRDGRIDFIDILAIKGAIKIACEVETTPRYVLVNVEKALALALPVWIVVPTRSIEKVIERKLLQALPEPHRSRICILLPDQLEQALTHCFPTVPSANA